MIAHTYEVIDADNKVHTIKAKYVFNNDGALCFRAESGDRTTVVAEFAAGEWKRYLRTQKSKSKKKK